MGEGRTFFKRDEILPLPLFARERVGVRAEDCLMADVFGLTYREFSEVKPTHYKWRLVAPAALENLRRAHSELWSVEKLADHLNSDPEEAGNSLRRYLMSERVNQGRNGAERISILFQEWLDRFEPDVHERKVLARDLSRLLSSQLYFAAQSGEKLEEIVLALEKMGDGDEFEKDKNGKSPWGPAWKD